MNINNFKQYAQECRKKESEAIFNAASPETQRFLTQMRTNPQQRAKVASLIQDLSVGQRDSCHRIYFVQSRRLQAMNTKILGQVLRHRPDLKIVFLPKFQSVKELKHWFNKAGGAKRCYKAFAIVVKPVSLWYMKLKELCKISKFTAVFIDCSHEKFNFTHLCLHTDEDDPNPFQQEEIFRRVAKDAKATTGLFDVTVDRWEEAYWRFWGDVGVQFDEALFMTFSRLRSEKRAKNSRQRERLLVCLSDNDKCTRENFNIGCKLEFAYDLGLNHEAFLTHDGFEKFHDMAKEHKTVFAMFDASRESPLNFNTLQKWSETYRVVVHVSKTSTLPLFDTNVEVEVEEEWDDGGIKVLHLPRVPRALAKFCTDEDQHIVALMYQSINLRSIYF